MLHWFSPGWVKFDGPATVHVKAKILLDNGASQCLGTALVRNDCWSFLKGGFTLTSPSQTSVLYFQVRLGDPCAGLIIANTFCCQMLNTLSS
jgi:hypothetical protein